MTHAELTIHLPEGTWIHDVSTSYPSAEFTVLAAMPDDESGFGLVRIRADEARSVLAAMERHDALTRVELLQGRAGEALVEFDTTRPMVLLSARESRVPIEPPVEIADGEATIEVTASRDRLSALASQLEASGLQFDVDHVQPRSETGRVLTDRQAELVRTALEEGFYDTPRTCSMTELAEEVGIAKSTCCETLHRAEEAIVKAFAETHLEDVSVEASVLAR